MIGQTISHYKIVEKLGEGGMGVVYKAQDTKLERFVALKFLPPHLSASEQDKARFIQEAKAASALNHPNVATIYEINEVDGQMFIAMEFVDGNTLRERKQTLSIKQVVDIGVQIADGLSAAHEQGIVHRDIKPENIMIRKDGIIQIMDFGLAKLRGVTKLTKEGSTLGTVGYMSPEQVQGLDTDHRTDIFSLGVVLYELLTGHLPFKGIHETAIMYEIVNVDPEPIAVIRQEVEPELDRIILECLEKERDERYQSVKEVSKDLKRFKRESSRKSITRKTIVREAYQPSQESREISGQTILQKILSINREKFAWIVAGLFFLSFLTIIFFYFQGSGTQLQTIRSFILPPEKNIFNYQAGGHIALSPDGLTLAFVATDSLGKNRLWIRPMRSLIPQAIAGTDGATYPFWSPDNRNVGFFASGKLKKIEVSGGPPLTICDATSGRGGTWNKNGIILFAPDQVGPIFQVSAAGGVPVAVTKLDSTFRQQTHRWPYFLPDGEHFIYYARTTAGGLENESDAFYGASLDGKVNKRFLPGAQSNILYTAGHILFLRESTLMAQQFDTKKMEMINEAFPVAEKIQFDLAFNRGVFSVSENNILTYQTGAAQTGAQLILFKRNGDHVSTLGEAGLYRAPRLSRDGGRMAIGFLDIQSRNWDIWLYDISRGVKTRFTFDPALEINPIWSPDGNQVVFSSDRKGHSDLYRKASSGAGSEELLFESNLNKYSTDWSSDGQYIAYVAAGDPKTKADLWILPLFGDRKPYLFLQTEFDEAGGRFSTDMRWIAYVSNESGRNEVYVRQFPGPGGKWQVSTTGGTVPRWRRDGKELFFFSDDSKLMGVDVKGTGSTLEVGIPHILFDMQSKGQTIFHDVTSDGQRFLMQVTVGGQTLSPLTLVTNWTNELKKK